MKYNQIREGKKYLVGITLKTLHNFPPMSVVTVDKKKSENQITCSGKDCEGAIISQNLFPECLLEIPNIDLTPGF